MKVSVNDFNDIRFAEIENPERGLFGYLLRCRSLPDEDVTGNIIFLDNGETCFERFPKEISERVLRRKPWTNSRWLYKNEFVGQLIYVDEDKLSAFVDLMEIASDSEVQAFLAELLDKAKSHPVARQLLASKLEPLFAVSHIRQLEDEVHMNIPHIHILWGKRKKKRNRN